MLPSDIVNAARDLYNATGDSYFSDTLMYAWIQQASSLFSRKANMIEATYSVSTASGTQSYTLPSALVAIKRVTYDGSKLKRLTFRQDDAVTLSNQASTSTGKPVYYTQFAGLINLRPIPDSIKTLVMQYYSTEPTISSGSQALLLPSLYHFDCVDYLLFRMYSKDQNTAMAGMYLQIWERHLQEALGDAAKNKRGDSFSTVQDEETLPVTIMGEV